MFKTVVCCNVCGEELKIFRKHTPFGDVDLFKTFQTKQWDTSKMLPHLCEKCALIIDNELLKLKLEVLQRGSDNDVE